MTTNGNIYECYQLFPPADREDGEISHQETPNESLHTTKTSVTQLKRTIERMHPMCYPKLSSIIVLFLAIAL